MTTTYKELDIIKSKNLAKKYTAILIDSKGKKYYIDFGDSSKGHYQDRTKLKQIEQKRGQEKARRGEKNKQPNHPPSGPLASSTTVTGCVAAQAHQHIRGCGAALVAHGRW